MVGAAARRPIGARRSRRIGAAARRGVATAVVLAAAVSCGERPSGPRLVRVGPDAAPEGEAVHAGRARRSGQPGTPGERTELQRIIEEIEGPARIELSPGHYHLARIDHVDPSCGNCQDPAKEVPATRGLLVRGRGIEIAGSSPEEVVLHSNSGYGVLFDGCEGCRLEGVTVTDGFRDLDPEATSGAVVVRESDVVIEGCHLRDNIGDEEVVAINVAGIAGLVGREGAEITVRGSRIQRNSWDGVALYRGASAEILDNVIDGVDRGRTNGSGGRGAGIGLTWDSEALVEGNLVRSYWKGIGVFVDARAEIRRNVVEDVLAWGIAVWDAGRGRPVAFIEHDVVYSTGACGVVITREAPAADGPDAEPVGSLVGNVVALTGLNRDMDSPSSYCAQVAIDRAAVPRGFRIEDNVLHANREEGGRAGRQDVSAAEFRRLIQPLLEKLREEPALAESRFLADFGDAAPR